MKRIGIISDLHLEFRDGIAKNKLLDKIKAAPVDLIINAGDTHPYPVIRNEFLCAMGHPFFNIMGNHDYYNRHWFDDLVIEKNMIGCCLWTDFANDPEVEFQAKHIITDFFKIDSWDIQRVKDIHHQHRQAIFKLQPPVVVTHFPPSEQCIVEKYKGDKLNGYFVNRLDEEILDSNIKLWVCGHTHAPYDLMIGDCRVVGNPLGYPREIYASDDDYQVMIIETDLLDD